jgi:hypothetical protein
VARRLELNVDTTADDKGLIEAAREFDRLGDKVDKAGRQMKETAFDARLLDAELDKAKRSARDLAQEFERTGNKDLFKQFREARSDLPVLTKMRAELKGMADEAARLKVAEEAAAREAERLGRPLIQRVREGITTGLSSAGDLAGQAVEKWPLAAAIAGGILVGAPLVAAAVGTVVSGAAIAGGILVAARDSRVKDAWSQLGRDAMASLTRSSAEFIDPLIASAHRLGQAFDTLPLNRIFHDAAQEVVPLTQGLIRLAQEASPGIERLVHASIPLITDLADRQLPKLGHMISEFADSMARAEPGAQQFFSVVLDNTEQVVEKLGLMIQVISQVYEKTNQLPAWLKQVFDPFHLTLFHDEATKLPPTFDDIGTHARAAAEDVAYLNQKFDDAFSTMMGSAEADDRFKRGMLEMAASVRQHGKSLSDNTLDGLANREMLRGLVRDAEAARQAHLKAGMGADEANTKYEQQIHDIEALAVKLGFSKDQTYALIDAFGHIERDIQVKITEFVYTNDLRTYRAGERSSYSPAVNAYSGGSHSQSGTGGGGLTRVRDAGGPVIAGETYMIGLNRRPEYFTPGASGYVTPLPAASSAAPPARGVTLNFAGNTDSGLARLFMHMIRTGQIQLTTDAGPVRVGTG